MSYISGRNELSFCVYHFRNFIYFLKIFQEFGAFLVTPQDKHPIYSHARRQRVTYQLDPNVTALVLLMGRRTCSHSLPTKKNLTELLSLMSSSLVLLLSFPRSSNVHLCEGYNQHSTALAVTQSSMYITKYDRLPSTNIDTPLHPHASRDLCEGIAV